MFWDFMVSGCDPGCVELTSKDTATAKGMSGQGSAAKLAYRRFEHCFESVRINNINTEIHKSAQVGHGTLHALAELVDLDETSLQIM